MAVGFTHVITRGYRDSSGGTISSTETIGPFNNEVNFDQTVNHSVTNGEYDVLLTAAKLKSISFYSDFAVTIKTNSSSSPQETITLAAGQNRVWDLSFDGAGAIPIAGDVTKLFITNASGSNDAHVQMRALQNL